MTFSRLCSTLKNDKVCERFEIYINGIELANCFNELTNFLDQKTRFDQQMKDRLAYIERIIDEIQDFPDITSVGSLTKRE